MITSPLLYFENVPRLSFENNFDFDLFTPPSRSLALDYYELEEPRFFWRRRRIRGTRIQVEQPEINEINSKNEKFIKEKDIKYGLYPLYINWKKIEIKTSDNNYFNIFKLFGYFGEAIYEILIETSQKIDANIYYTYKNYINELNKLYKKEYEEEEINRINFLKKIMSIKEDVFSLLKNKIVLFKEIPIFLIILKFYQSIYTSLKDKNNVVESLKYQFTLLNDMKEDEYDIIYNTYLKKFKTGRYLCVNNFQKNKEEYLKRIKSDYKSFK